MIYGILLLGIVSLIAGTLDPQLVEEILVPSGQISTTDFQTILAVPDIHGDRQALLKSLWMGLLKTEIAVSTTFEQFVQLFERAIVRNKFPDNVIATRTDVMLISLGDVNDRGPFSLFCYEVLRVVPDIIGWSTRHLYGNHEILSVLNLSEHFSQVHPLDHDLFGGKQARCESFGRDGLLSEYFRDNYLGMVRLSSVTDPVANTLFVHGGVDPVELEDWKDLSIDGINQVFAKAMMAQDSDILMRLIDDTSFLGSRLLANGDEQDVCQQIVEPILSHFNVTRIVIGHTIQPLRRVGSKCRDRVLLIDVVMSRWMANMKISNEEQGAELAQPVIFKMDTDRTTGSLTSITAHFTGLGDSNSPISNQVIYPRRTATVVPRPFIDPRRQRLLDRMRLRSEESQNSKNIVIETPSTSVGSPLI
jgi:hypothetical protein